MHKKTTQASTIPAERLAAYSALAQSLRKTHSQRELLKAATKGALAVTLPAVAVTLPTVSINAQCGSETQIVATRIVNSCADVYLDIDGDGIADINIFKAINGAAAFYILNGGLNLAGYTNSNYLFPFNFALSSPLTAGATFIYRGTGYLNRGPLGDFPMNTNDGIIALSLNGQLGFIRVSVSGTNCVSILSFGVNQVNPPGTAITVGDCNSLPVELTYFKAQASTKSIQLFWATESETNNAGFEIERSQDGKKFHKIGFVKGHNTTLEAHEYTFADNTIFPNTTYYYRLKQVDHDGAYAYSAVQTVVLKNEKEISVSEFFPNPATSTVQLQLNTALDGKAVIELFNSTGQRLRTIQEGVQAGTTMLQLDVSDLPLGTYFAKIQLGEQFVYKKLVVGA